MPGLCREFRCSTPLPPQTCSPGRTVFFPLTRASASRSWTATCRTISVASNISCGIAPGPLRTRATLGDPRRRRPHHPRPLRAAPALWPPTGSARDGRENPRGPMRMASSSCRRLNSATGSPISCRHHENTGTGTRASSRQITRRDGHAAGDCCDSGESPAHTTPLAARGQSPPCTFST